MNESIESGVRSIRSGIGYDLHRLEEGQSFVLGGENLDASFGPVGHSDADALLHAVADACLGAAGLRDMGHYFPDDDPAYEDISSRRILRQVVEKIRDRGYTVTQVDTVVQLEQPALSGVIPEMTENLSELLSVPTGAVGIKATRNEGLGPVGRGEAVIARATVLLRTLNRDGDES